MSLNGLDAAEISEAYEAASKEPGGWFLLKYVSRDEVGLLSRGNGGVIETREAIGQFTEASPLYGFIQYRRRKVLIRYIPEGTSRLLQARVSVHFQSVTDKFSPYDTIFHFTSPSDLKDTKLSFACSLHTASASTSSSNSSLRRQRLVEIAEDAEEGQTAASRYESTSNTASAQGEPEIVEDEEMNARHGVTVPGSSDREDLKPESMRSGPADDSLDLKRSTTAATAPPLDLRISDETIRPFDPLSRPSLDAVSMPHYSRPSTSQLYDPNYNPYMPKPKVKLGPRPSLDSSGRPHTSGTSRPVATLPAGLRAAQRKSGQVRPKSSQSSKSSIDPSTFPLPPPVPEVPAMHKSTPIRPISSPGSVLSSSASLHSSSPRTPGMTPEKQRLMKALQLRKKQMSARAAMARSQSPSRSESEEARNVPQLGSGAMIAASPKIGASMQSPSHRSGASESFQTEAIASSHEIYPTPDISRGAQSPVEGPDSQIDKSEEMVTTGVEDLSPRASLSLGEGENRQGVGHDTETAAGTIPKEEPEIITPSTMEKSFALPESSDELSSDDDSPSATPQLPSSSSSATESTVKDTHLPTGRQHQQNEASFGIDNSTISRNIQGDTDEVPTLKVDIEESSLPSEPDVHVEGSPAQNEKCAESSLGRSTKRASGTRGIWDPVSAEAADISEDNFLSDDSFMEELKRAEVQEAKPISVSKSPRSPLFPRDMGDRRPSNSSIISQNFRRPSHTGSEFQSDLLSPNPPVAVAKKINVSSGISKRIKALEMRTSRESSPVAPNFPSTPTSSSFSPFAAFRNSTLWNHSRSSSIALSQSAAQEQPTAKPAPSPSTSASSDTFAHQSQPSSAPHHPSPAPESPREPRKSRPESISVTARIVRDPTSQKADMVVVTGNAHPGELRESPLMIEHQKATSSRQKTKSTPTSIDQRSFIVPSSPSPKSVPSSPTLTRPPSVSSRQSTSSRSRSQARSPSIASEPSNTAYDPAVEKKESRKSRLLRRMSSISNASRKSLIHAISPTLQEEEPMFEIESSIEQRTAEIEVGEVNVQFPDTLVGLF
ncbi:MAG: hypothetical protein M1819_000313 [Sarea resinae]|nr:MAG: hypothetical protein M1819_000313 [Sarea resinae]